jgi:hypothetical protein
MRMDRTWLEQELKLAARIKVLSGTQQGGTRSNGSHLQHAQ